MRSWNIDKFVKEFGAHRLTVIWGKSRQAVNKAMKANRSIRIVELDDCFEVWESKLLATSKLSAVKLDSMGAK